MIATRHANSLHSYRINTMQKIECKQFTFIQGKYNAIVRSQLFLVPLESVYLVFTCTADESYCR